MFLAVSNEVVDLIRVQSPAILGFCWSSMATLALKNSKATFLRSAEEIERETERARQTERETDFILILNGCAGKLWASSTCNEKNSA